MLGSKYRESPKERRGGGGGIKDKVEREVGRGVGGEKGEREHRILAMLTYPLLHN